MKELTYVMIKPDGVKKQIQTDVLKTFRDNGLEINIMQTDILSNNLGSSFTRICDARLTPKKPQLK